MKKFAGNFVWLLVALLGTSRVHADNVSDTLSIEAKTNFTWFSSLGFPDVKECSFGNIATGLWRRWDNQPPTNTYHKAFIISDTTTNFTTLSLDLFERTLIKTTNVTPEHQRVWFDRLNLKNEAEALLEAYAGDVIEKVTFPELDERISKQAKMFVFAWGCWRNGLNSEAERLYQLSKTLRYGSEEIDEEKFHEFLQGGIGNSMMWRAVVDVGDTSLTRRQLLGRFQTVVTNYPHYGGHEGAKLLVEMLQQMIVEDETHARSAPTNLSLLPVEERVRELIFQLRDQHGEQNGQPGICDIFSNLEKNTNTPAHQLAAIGYAAVPQLIAALEDGMLTRSVGYWRDFTFSHTVLTVGDCANDILGRITGKFFYSPTYSSGYMSKDNKAAEAHKLADEWWAEFQKKGEKQMLIDGVSSGVGSAHVQAEMLGKRFPEALVPALIQGARVSTVPWTTRHFISLLATNDSVEAKEFLKNALHDGSALCRATAALTLVHKDRAGTIAAMIQEWERYTNSIPPFDFESSLPIAHFLAAMDSREIIAALKHNLHLRPISMKNAVINEVAGCTWNDHFCLINHIRERAPSESALVEEFLISFLQDKDPLQTRPGDYYWKTRPGMRICDEAGYYLNRLWPNRYSFNANTDVIGEVEKTIEKHDRQIAAIQAAWKQAHPEK